MSVKTISLKLEAHERLRAARRYPTESFSEEEFLAPFFVLASSPEVSWQFGHAYRYLQEHGLLIAANSLWIAATGLAHRMPVVTRNVQHYRRVPGLRVEAS